jgi:hypothetical protein
MSAITHDRHYNQFDWKLELTMKQQALAHGGCQCGAIRYDVLVEPYKVSFCHCDSCRKATGAPLVVMVMFDRGQVRFTRGEPRRYESSSGVYRGHCDTCGTPLTWEGSWDGRDIFELHAGTLDDPERFAPTRHAFTSRRISWMEINDDLPKFPHAGPSR